MNKDQEDERWIRTALLLAGRSLGNSFPNPAVGCVLVKNGCVVGRGWTQAGGRPHAETEALKRSGKNSIGATAYVTLEPCSHYGQTPPCVNALIAGRVKRVVIAMIDPDKRVAGNGILMLQKAGIETSLGCLEAEAKQINSGYLHRLNGRPQILVKIATSLDGKIATRTGDSKWITNSLSRNIAHKMRATNDAIMVGIGTVLADNPMLNCRLPGLEHLSPIRCIIDKNLDIALNCNLVITAKKIKTIIFTNNNNVLNDKANLLSEAGLVLVPLPLNKTGYFDLNVVLSVLAEIGVGRLLVEGGQKLITNFLQNNLVDKLAWFRSPLIIGGDGRNSIAKLGIDQLIKARLYKHLSTRHYDDDSLDIYTNS